MIKIKSHNLEFLSFSTLFIAQYNSYPPDVRRQMGTSRLFKWIREFMQLVDNSCLLHAALLYPPL